MVLSEAGAQFSKAQSFAQNAIALLKTAGFTRHAAGPFLVIFGGLGRRCSEWKERRREERKRRGSYRLDQPTPKKELPKAIAQCPHDDLKIRARGMFVMTTVTKVSIFGSLSFAK